MADRPSKLLSSRQIKVAGHGCRVGEPGGPSPPREPKVQLVQTGGVIQGVEIVCSCGELIRLRFDFAEDAVDG